MLSAKTSYKIGKVVYCKDCGSTIENGIPSELHKYDKIVGDCISDDEYEDLCGKNMYSFGKYNKLYYDISKGQKYFSTGKILLIKKNLPFRHLCPPGESFRKKYFLNRNKLTTKFQIN